MSDTDGKKPLGLGGSRPGQVKQSFSHGRTKNVVVETKRKRVVVPQKPGTPGAASGPSHLGDPAKRPAGISDAEMERRLAALRAAKAREAEEAAQRLADEKAREEERRRKRDEIEAREREERERAEAARLKAEEEERAKVKAEAEARARRAAEARKTTEA
ncbi:MAG: IF-2-associated domain-containing protein, partial [Rhodobacterales bacterium]|nr:IF-2-associated domain-containing protein [Rhodobacterales bacterium]